MKYLVIGLLFTLPVAILEIWAEYQFICRKKHHPINAILAKRYPKP